MKLAVLFTTLFTGLCFAADAKEDAAKDKEKLQGTWKVLKATKEGESKSDEDLKKLQVVIAGDKLTFKDGNQGRDETFAFTIDPAQKPATIDLTIEKAKLTTAKQTIKGIYELDKDTLKICVGLEGDKRPTEFKSGEKSGTALLVLEREKK
jgi:uncharacterized protein (TIGR03067 family)